MRMVVINGIRYREDRVPRQEPKAKIRTPKQVRNKRRKQQDDDDS